MLLFLWRTLRHQKGGLTVPHRNYNNWTPQLMTLEISIMQIIAIEKQTSVSLFLTLGRNYRPSY